MGMNSPYPPGQPVGPYSPEFLPGLAQAGRSGTQLLGQPTGAGEGQPNLAPMGPPAPVDPIAELEQSIRELSALVTGPRSYQAQIAEAIARQATDDELKDLRQRQQAAAEELGKQVKTLAEMRETARKQQEAQQRKEAAQATLQQQGVGVTTPLYPEYDTTKSKTANWTAFNERLNTLRLAEQITDKQVETLTNRWVEDNITRPEKEAATAAAAQHAQAATMSAQASQTSAGASVLNAQTGAFTAGRTAGREEYTVATGRGDKALDRATIAEQNQRYAAYRQNLEQGMHPNSAFAAAIKQVPYATRGQMDDIVREGTDGALTMLRGSGPQTQVTTPPPPPPLPPAPGATPPGSAPPGRTGPVQTTAIPPVPPLPLVPTGPPQVPGLEISPNPEDALRPRYDPTQSY